MFRLLKDSAQFIMLALVYVRYVAGLATYRQLRDSYLVWLRANPNVMPQTLATLMDYNIQDLGGYQERPTVDGILEALLLQLVTPRGEGEDRELIDMVVKAAGMPFGGRHGTDKMKAIQKAILTPNELGSLQDALRAKEMTCHSCAAPLHNSELVTFYADGVNPRIYCYRCMTPTVVGCHTCLDGGQVIDRKFYVGKSTSCAAHADPRAELPMPAIYQMDPPEELEAAPPRHTWTTANATVRGYDDLAATFMENALDGEEDDGELL